VASFSEVQHAVVAASSGGDNTLVAGVAAKAIRVVSLVLVASGGANSVRLESAASGTALTGVMDLVSDGQLVLPYNPAGWCQAAAAALLNLELSAGTAVGGVLGYVLVD
jgi:PP-loop superfamily ATP-utilizing enzyme